MPSGCERHLASNGSLIITNLKGRVTFVSEPVTGIRHDMAKLKGSDAENILRKAGGVLGDKGFIGTDYITTPVRKPESRGLLCVNSQLLTYGLGLRRPRLSVLPLCVCSLTAWQPSLQNE
jgi:hypothetical protein